MDRLQVTVTRDETTVVVTIAGEAGSGQLDLLRAHIDQLTRERAPRMIVDVSTLQFIASLGLGELVRLALSVRNRAGTFRVCGAHDGISLAINKSKLVELLPLFRDVAHAMQ